MAPELDLPRAVVQESPATRVPEALLRTLFEDASDGILLVDAAGRVLEVNPRLLELTGFERAELLGRCPSHVLGASWEPREGRGMRHEQLLQHKNGSSFPAQIERRRLPDGGVLTIVRDLSEQRHAEAKIRDLSRLYALLSHVNQAVIRSRERQDLFQTVCDAAVEHGGFRMAWIGAAEPDGRVRPVAHAGYANALDYLLGLEITLADGELGGGPVGRVLREGGVSVCEDVRTDPRLAPWRSAALSQGFATIASVALQVNEQSVAALTVYGQRAGFFAGEELRLIEELGADISAALAFMDAQAEKQRAIDERARAEAEREQLRSQLEHTQKLESIGRLAGAVAHDFNNMLTVILSGTDSCLRDARTHPQIQSFLREIRDAATRSASLSRQLLTFARKQPALPQRLNINRVVDDALAILRRLLGEHIELIWQPEAALWPIQMDPGQLGQIITNLSVNARDALAGAGQVQIATANVSLDRAYSERHPDVVPGDYVRLRMRDTGCGMDAEVQANIFEPFFTTKKPGQGTGLGLSTVYGIVKQSRGFIQVTSAPGKGTEIEIYLPRSS